MTIGISFDFKRTLKVSNQRIDEFMETIKTWKVVFEMRDHKAYKVVSTPGVENIVRTV